MDSSFSHIGIIGMGLVGASLCGALSEAYPDCHVIGVDTEPATLDVARERNWVNRAFLPDDEELDDALLQCDLVIVSTPVTAVLGYFEHLASIGYEGVISDTASTKGHIATQAIELLTLPQNYIPGHPMAGSEKSGIDGARADLFRGAHWILCPDESTPAEDYAHLHELLTGIGARVVSLPREDHDEAVAIVSHVPHFVASSLVELAVRHAGSRESLFRLAAGGFKDSTRIAAGSPELWTGIAFENREAITSGLSEMEAILSQFERALEAGDRAAFKSLLEEAAAARRALPAKWVPDTEDLLEVRIPMLDRKGVVAEVTTIASQVGCNIQSIEIDHITSSSAVLSMVLTDEGDVGRLSGSLIKAGFGVSFNPLTAKEYSHVEQD